MAELARLTGVHKLRQSTLAIFIIFVTASDGAIVNSESFPPVRLPQKWIYNRKQKNSTHNELMA